ncbi:MAG: glycosyltransferase family 2 protein [Thermodesulfobacteriota bacterium]
MAELFSIVTVCLNAGKSLIKSVNSVIGQDFPSFHYIVKDGVSTDDSVGDLPHIDRLTVISKADNGIYDAMNQALDYCEGEYVCFLNAGDTFHSPDTLSSVARCIQRNQGASICIGNAVVGEELKIHPKRFSSAFLYEGHICHQAVFVKRQLYLAEKGFNTNYRLLADRDFFIRAIWVRREPYCVLPLTICDYDVSGVTARKEYQYLKEYELRQIQNTYFGLRHRVWIWFYLKLAVKPFTLLRRTLVK